MVRRLPNFTDEPVFIATALECGFFPDEPRRIEPDAAWIPDDDEPELSQWANRMGYDFQPGQSPTPIAGF